MQLSTRPIALRAKLAFAIAASSMAFVLDTETLFAQEAKVVRNQDTPAPTPPSGEGWTRLFDGKSIAGWTQRNGWASYRIEGDAVVGRTATGSPNSFLCTDKVFGDFELRFEVKVDNGLNSGVQIRSKSLPEKDNGRVHGLQVEIESSPGEAGYLYGEATGRGWVSPTQPPHSELKNNEWNQYHVKAVGPRVQTWINGKLIEDLTDPISYTEGFIGLQVHGIGKDQGPFEVRWRNIEIKELSKK